MSKTKILFIIANDSKAIYPHLYGAGGSSPARESQESNDYLSDAIFQYFKNTEEFEVYECPWMIHMYTDSISKKEELSGFGFALRKEITKEANILTSDEAHKRIIDKEFDYLVSDSRTCSPWWHSRGLSPFQPTAVALLNKAMEVYDASNIIFFDGEDQTNIDDSIINRVTYFKRELTFDHPLVHPIGYCFPKNKFRDSNIATKKKTLATVIPGEKNTYKFVTENAYYEDYNTSMYGLTWKKLGWDCFRHHEILFSSCIPIFPDISECPSQTLTRFPKLLCKEILDTGIIVSAKKYQKYHDLYCFTDIILDYSKINKNQYSDILGRIKEHALNQLSSESVANYVLSVMGRKK